MPWTYDADSDEIVVRYQRPADDISESVRMAKGVVELDTRRDPVRVTVYRASSYVSVEDLRRINGAHHTGEQLHSIHTVARSLGLRASRIRQDILVGALPVVHTGRTWCVRPGVLEIYRVVLTLAREAGDRALEGNPEPPPL
jgi:hypothetical protein